MPLMLNETAVASLLRMEDLVDLMERALADFSSGRALQPVRTALSIDRHRSLLAVMPGYLPTSEALAVKIVSLAPENAARGIPTHLATILLHDPMTGALLALMDGRLITEMRTAAVSAAAARALARPEATTLALIGAGVQAKSHLEALRLVRKLTRVRVWSPSAARREAFAREEAERWGLPVTVCDSAEKAVRGADLVITVTSSHEPVVRGEWLAPGAHVTAVGACRADWRELDAEAVRRASVYVDSRAAARVEAGDVLRAIAEGAIGEDHVRGEIGELFERRESGRTSGTEITLFKSLGLAVEDAATAQHVWNLAQVRGVGTAFEL